MYDNKKSTKIWFELQILLIVLKDSKIIQVISRYPIHNVKHSSEMLQIPLKLAWKWPNYQQILKILMSHNFTNSKNKSWSWWRQIYRKLGSSKRVSTVPHMDGVKSSNYVLSPRSYKNDDRKPQHAMDTRPNSATRHFQHFTVQCNDLKKWCFYSFKDSNGTKILTIQLPDNVYSIQTIYESVSNFTS